MLASFYGGCVLTEQPEPWFLAHDGYTGQSTMCKTQYYSLAGGSWISQKPNLPQPTIQGLGLAPGFHDGLAFSAGET